MDNKLIFNNFFKSNKITETSIFCSKAQKSKLNWIMVLNFLCVCVQVSFYINFEMQ